MCVVGVEHIVTDQVCLIDCYLIKNLLFNIAFQKPMVALLTESRSINDFIGEAQPKKTNIVDIHLYFAHQLPLAMHTK